LSKEKHQAISEKGGEEGPEMKANPRRPGGSSPRWGRLFEGVEKKEEGTKRRARGSLNLDYK